MLKKILSLALSLLLIVSCSKKEDVKSLESIDTKLIPTEFFSRLIENVNCKISSDGKYSALTRLENDRQILVLVNNETDSVKHFAINAVSGIAEFRWLSSGLLAITCDTNQNGFNELYLLKPADLNYKKISGEDDTDFKFPELETRINNTFFVEISDKNQQNYSLYRLDATKQKTEQVLKNPGNYLSYIADNHGKILIVNIYENNTSSVLYRSNESQPFKTIFQNTAKEVISPICFSADNQKLIVTTNTGRDKAAIMEYNLAENKLGQVLVEDSDADIYEVIKSGSGDFVGAIVERDSLSFVYTNQPSEQIQKEVNQLFPGKTVKISDRSRDDNSLILEIFNGSHPGEIYYYNRTAKKVNLLLNLASWLKDDELAAVKSVVLETKDKLKLFCYLTEPVKPNGAAVILVHDGPWIRESKRYNAEAQFLANRGYLVMQVNFRGSLGFGRKFLERGYQEWGRGMINDLATAAEWLKNERKMDRIGIAGTSFAGYSALRALQLYPDLFKCAVTQSALINILDLRNKTYSGENDFNNLTIGHPGRDISLLKNSSPYYNYSAMEAPVMLVYGENDQLVDLKQVDSLVVNLQKQGMTIESHRKKKDGHILQDYQNQADYYTLIEKFLQKYLLEQK